MKLELNKNTYLLDSVPISPRELIKEASLVDKEFEARIIKFTTEAAQILKDLGHTVERNI